MNAQSISHALLKQRPREVYVLLGVIFFFLFMDYELGTSLRRSDFYTSPIANLIKGIGDLRYSDAERFYWALVLLYWFVGISRVNSISNFLWRRQDPLL